MKPVVGFLGNSLGMTELQEKNLHALLDELNVDVIHHTNASGAERDAHYMFLCGSHAEINVHEPLDYYGRAVATPIEPRVIARPYQSALAATVAVLAASDLIIVAPANHTDRNMKQLLAGTKKGQAQVFASIVCRTEPLVREAARLNKKLIILREDGQVIRYEQEQNG